MKLKTTFKTVIVLLLIISSCQSQELKYSKPVMKNDGWQTASISGLDINQQKLIDLFADLDEEVFPNTHALLIVRDGKLIFEKYLNGYTAKQKQYTASISKSVGSVLIGIAIQEAFLDGIQKGILDRKIGDLFIDYAELLESDSLKQKILYRHILSMTGGLEWDEQTYSYSDLRNDWIAASNRKDPFTYLFSKDMENNPGTVFNYNGAYSLLLSQQIEDLYGMTALEFAKVKLFRPLQIKDYEWERLDCGLTDTDGGLHLRPRDMAKIGQLYLNHGSWNGKQIVDPSWVTESTKEQVISFGMPNYGFQWWCGTFHSASASSYTFFASGHGGQKIYVFPEYDAVIVVTHKVFDNDQGEVNNIRLLSNYILPALSNSDDSSLEVSLTSAIHEKYIGVYENEHESFELVSDDGLLFIREESRPDMLLWSRSDGAFVSTMPEGIEVCVHFIERDDIVTGLSVDFSFRELTFTKVQ